MIEIKDVLSIIAISMSIFTFWYLRSQPKPSIAKLTDRLYDLDKLILSNTDTALHFYKLAERKEPYFYAANEEVARDENYIKLKAFCYYILNFHHEIFNVLNALDMKGTPEYDIWRKSIVRRTQHPLLLEIFTREAEHIYSRKYVEFINNGLNDPNCTPIRDVW